MAFLFDNRTIKAGVKPQHPSLTLLRQLRTTHAQLAKQSTDTVAPHPGAAEAILTSIYTPTKGKS